MISWDKLLDMINRPMTHPFPGELFPGHDGSELDRGGEEGDRGE